MHTLFVKEHNAIAAKLAAAYPNLTDQQLFDKARMITAAVIAKIHTIEWTPAILPNNNLAAAMHGNWDGLISMLLPPEADVAAALTDNIFQDEKEGMFGFRGQPRNDWGTPYSMTEVGGMAWHGTPRHSTSQRNIARYISVTLLLRCRESRLSSNGAHLGQGWLHCCAACDVPAVPLLASSSILKRLSF
jgi:hypothetical protein